MSSDSNEASLEPRAVPKARRSALDIALNVFMVALVVALLGLGAYFGYTVYLTRQQQAMASPAYQVIQQVKAQVRAKPNDPLGRVLLAEALASDGQFDEAKAQLKTAIGLDPKNASAYLDVAKIALIQKDPVSAEKALNKVLELTTDPQFENVNQRRQEAYFMLGEIALKNRQYEDTVGYMKAAIRINRADSQAYLRLAQGFIGMGETDAAKQNLSIALAFDPKYPEANYELGKIYLAEGDKAKAAEAFQASLQGNPNAPQPAEALASIGDFRTFDASATAAFKAGDWTGALDAARIARAMDPKSVSVAILEAKVLEKLSRQPDALAVWQNVVTLEPANKEAIAAVARLSAETAKKGGSK